MEAGRIEGYSDDIEVFRFDLMADNHRPEERQLQITARRTGAAIGLLQWLRLHSSTMSTRSRTGRATR